MLLHRLDLHSDDSKFRKLLIIHWNCILRVLHWTSLRRDTNSDVGEGMGYIRSMRFATTNLKHLKSEIEQFPDMDSGDQKSM